MGVFSKKPGGLMDVIRCDEPSYLIWRWHPSGSQKEANGRANSIRWGSSLRVKDGEVAVFVYRQREGVMQDFIVGPFDETIKTANFPVLANIVGLAYDGGTPFQAEVYFINLARVVQVKFVVPYFDVYDPRFSDFGVPVAVRGTVSFHIEDYEGFIKLHRLSDFDLEDFQRQIRDAVTRYVKDAVANAPASNNIPLVQIETKTAQINDIVEYDISERLKETFGVTVSGVDIGTIEIDKSSEGYRRLMSITRDLAGATAKAETEAKIRDIEMKQKIEAENYAETLRIQREEGQYAQHKSTQSANLGAFQVEKQAEVGVAGAEALGQMGSNGAGDIDFGSGGEGSGNGNGFNMAAMMASMTVGGAVGQNIAGTMNNMMSSVNQSNQQGMPPVPPESGYYVAVNGQATGPFDITVLTQMVSSGQLKAESLIWKAGMPQWEKAGSVDNLMNLFTAASIMPKIPTE